MATCMAMLAVLAGVPGILAALLILAVVFCVWAPRTARAADNAPASAPAAAVTAQAVKGLGRAEIQQSLQKLAETPAPDKLKPGAMCYMRAMPANRLEYVCPKCGEKTLYTNDSAQAVGWDIQGARRQIQELQKAAGAGVTLDESQFCRKCSPDVKDPKLVLKIVYGDGKPQVVSGVSPEDLKLLVEFFSGKLVHDRGMTGEKPLKDYSARLQELLGVAGAAAK